MEQLFDNPFTSQESTLKMSLSHHKQIKAAAFVAQDRYCLILKESCPRINLATVPPLYLTGKMKVIQITFSSYSDVPNCRVDPNKRAGGKNPHLEMSIQTRISVQGGKKLPE